MCEKSALIKQVRKQLFLESGFCCLCIDLQAINYLKNKLKVGAVVWDTKVPLSIKNQRKKSWYFKKQKGLLQYDHFTEEKTGKATFTESHSFAEWGRAACHLLACC